MKRKALLIMLLMAMIAPSAIAQKALRMNERTAINLDGLQVMNTPVNANRDAKTLTVNDGETTNNYVPIPGSSVGNGIETEFVIPAETLAELAPEEGFYSNITSLTFYTSRTGQSASWGNGQFLVFLKEYENESDIPDFFFNPNDMTLVYYGSLSVSSKEMSVAFNQVEGFEYFGGYLTVCFYEYTNGTAANVAWYGVSAQNAAAYWNGTNGYLAHFLPKMTFTYTTEVATCVIPNDFVASNVTTTTADLSWNERGESDLWQVIYCSPTDTLGVLVSGTPECTLEGLAEGTEYDVYLRALCDTVNGEYTDFTFTSFETHTTCEAPSNLSASNISSNSADLRWTGYADAYNLRYREYVEHDTTSFTQVGSDITTGSDFTEYEFDLSSYSGQGYIAIRHYNVTDMFYLDIQSIGVYDADDNELLVVDFSQGIGVPDGWHNIDADGDGYKWSNSGSFVYSASYINGVGALTPDNWLVTPLVDLGGVVVVTAKGQASDYSDEVFGVFVSTTELVENEWSMVENIAGTSYTLDNLEMDVTYEAQVTANCDTPEWSDNVMFTTASILFNKDGNWNVADNWLLGEVPAEGSNVVIAANCIIPAGYTANAGAITIGENGSLTIQDGGQLIHTNEGVVATMEKEIKGYTSLKDNYYLIASPVVNQEYAGYEYYLTFPAEVENMLSNEYDLYGFDCTEELEWRNYEADAENFVMLQGMGYLYANSGEKTTLKFTGELIPFESTLANNYSLLTYEASDENFNGFNLVGNTFAADAYIVIANYESGTGITGLAEDVYFYAMGDGELVAGTGAVAPMQGVMVQASSDSQVALCFTEALRSNKALNISLSNANGLVDAAYIRFNGGSELSKIQLNPNHTKVFFTKDNQDYAVVNSEAQGEMPVSFKAEENGTYTLSINTENVELGYLHLIDNMTGNDVDLLSNPSYSFEASTTDYASRFKLVFATGNDDDNFAFYSNGNFVVNNEGNATVQVIDVNGRILSSETINGCANLNVNAAAGVYMLRLVNGSSVKVQKVVVK